MLELALPLIFGLTTLASVFGVFGDDDHTPDTDDGNDDIHPDEPQSEKEQIDIDPDLRGSFVGAEGPNIITVSTETDFQTTHLWDKYEEEMTSSLEVRGGGGNDVLLLAGRGYVVRGDEGADKIELRAASNVAVFAGADDTVLGGSGQGNYVRLDENATFTGCAGSDLVHSSSSAPTYLGDGDDTYFGMRSPLGNGHVASVVDGGGGDDHLVGSVNSENLWWEHATDHGYISFDADTIVGGEGNDTIVGSHGDSILGGSGSDDITLVLGNDPLAEGATIADFRQGEDRVEIRYESSYLIEIKTGAVAPASYQDFQTRIDPLEGFSVLTTDGQVIARFPGAASLTVGFCTYDTNSSSFNTIDLDGNMVAIEDCDIVIKSLSISSVY